MKVCAIVVLYFPEFKLLTQVIDCILSQFEEVIIIDNGSDVTSFFDGNNKIDYFNLKNNRGIAYAHNYGINVANQKGYDYVCIFDQDSVIPVDFLSKMSDAYQALNDKGINVGVIGPRAVSRASGERYIGKFDKGVFSQQGYTEISQVISSGSMLAVRLLNEFGGFKESMFIDLVDFEWCWRLKKEGFKHFIIEDVSLEHMFGQEERRVLGFRITAPSSFRIFYQFRNFIWLLPTSYTPLYWKLSNSFKLSVKFFLLPIWFWDYKYLKNSCKGLVHGLFKRKNFKSKNSIF